MGIKWGRRAIGLILTAALYLGCAPSYSPKGRDCPKELPLSTRRDAGRAVVAAATEAVPRVYAPPNSSIDTTGFSIVSAYLADPKQGFGKIVSQMCGEIIAERTWIVNLRFPGMEPSASASQGQIWVSRFKAAGWKVWYVYH